MRHFIGGASVGLVFALARLNKPKPCPEMTDIEFAGYLGAHFLCAGLFGLAAWGLYP